ncbi:MAG: L,D-transpeptidase family protein, partial [Methylocystis sp.]|nr:L,D-transpeptidase family protein [Methylocystis sp.]
YPAPDFASLTGAEALVDADIKLTNSLLIFARHLAAGRIAPARVVAEVDYGNHTPEPADILKKISEARDAGAALDGFNPPHQGFRALKEKLAELRRGSAQPDHRIADGAVIKPGAKDARVPALREKLGLAGKPDDLSYDKALLNAVKKVQERADIKPTGLIDAKTLAAINGPTPAQTIERIAANMERWRWLPRDLGEERVEVNIPDFELALVRNGEVAHRARVIVGKETTPTPIFSNALQYLIVNPYWNVPPSILNKEMLPKANGDVAAIAASGFNVSYRGGKLVVRQPPGERNALGRIKFMFPNDFSVYLHDTPSRNLFAASHRAFSHGCMRVDAPFAFAEAVLGPGSGWSESRVRRLIGGSERYINLAKPLPIHIEYFTAYVDEGGRIVLRPDLYGYSARVRKALGLGA